VSLSRAFLTKRGELCRRRRRGGGFSAHRATKKGGSEWRWRHGAKKETSGCEKNERN
jgi:hypothetical protein